MGSHAGGRGILSLRQPAYKQASHAHLARTDGRGARRFLLPAPRVLSRPGSLLTRGRLWLAIGDQGMDVLNRQAWIRLVEPDGSAVCRRRKVNELLEMLSAWRRRRALGEFE